MVLMPGYYVRMLSTRGQSACSTNGSKVLHQRLNVEHPSSFWFCQWLVGVTDGDGTFSISSFSVVPLEVFSLDVVPLKKQPFGGIGTPKRAK